MASKEQIGRNRGLICFSQRCNNPVLWAHYADSHKGLCLGFDVPDDLPFTVSYINSPMKLKLDQTTASQMLFTKYDHWAYEEEVRVWAVLDEKSGSHYFHKFGPQLLLTEIIVGAACSVSKGKVLDALARNQHAIAIWKTRPAYDSFRMVPDEDGLGFGSLDD
jgi:hypothetical protein